MYASPFKRISSLIFQIICAFLFTLFFPFPGWASKKLKWPLEVNYGLSATFGEYRPSHLHSGLDFKTNGDVGYKVFAVEDGQLYRLLVKKRGYGKAVYIKHPDGKISVYAHLERFEDHYLDMPFDLSQVIFIPLLTPLILFPPL